MHNIIYCNIIGYYVSFAILLLVPIDVAAVIMDRRAPGGPAFSKQSYFENLLSLSTTYSVLFAFTLVLGSFVLVFEEYFNTDGYFGPVARAMNSLKRLCYDIILGVVAGGILLGVLIGSKMIPSDGESLQLCAVIVTNSIYETFLIGLHADMYVL